MVILVFVFVCFFILFLYIVFPVAIFESVFVGVHYVIPLFEFLGAVFGVKMCAFFFFFLG